MSVACGGRLRGSSSFAGVPGTVEQQMACTPDVFRLCGAQIPDVNRIVACLQQNTAQLSGPCRAVFDSSATSSASAPPQYAPQLGRRDYR